MEADLSMWVIHLFYLKMRMRNAWKMFRIRNWYYMSHSKDKLTNERIRNCHYYRAFSNLTRGNK